MASQGALDDLKPEMLGSQRPGQAGVPLHAQLEGTLRRLIESGRIRPGAMIPGELELAAELGLSRHTVRHALGVLSSEGLLRRERGRGTRVVADAAPRVFERALDAFYAFAWEVRARGEEQRSFVLERETIRASPELAARLETAPATDIERIVRLRTANGEPLVTETAYLPRELTAPLTNEALERGAIYDALENIHGLRVSRARETIRPVVLERLLARLLHVKTGSAAFLVERTTWADRGPIEWQESIVRGDRYLYSVDLVREKQSQ